MLYFTDPTINCLCLITLTSCTACSVVDQMVKPFCIPDTLLKATKGEIYFLKHSIFQCFNIQSLHSFFNKIPFTICQRLLFRVCDIPTISPQYLTLCSLVVQAHIRQKKRQRLGMGSDISD